MKKNKVKKELVAFEEVELTPKESQTVQGGQGTFIVEDDLQGV